MMEPSFEKLLVKLADAGVRFILVGGLAVTLQGYVRFTEDVDILVECTKGNIDRLLACLGDYGEGFARELTPDDFDEEEGAIRIVEETEQCQLDIFTRMSGLNYADILTSADVFALSGREVRYASKAALIHWKQASVREKDRLDAMALQKLIADPGAFD
ncbi:MAG: nucleotidyltransferase [Verrucomicrobiales bacterium]|nr:nucleotidyltransferase [Verrucomicrobiales bacterium]